MFKVVFIISYAGTFGLYQFKIKNGLEFHFYEGKPWHFVTGGISLKNGVLQLVASPSGVTVLKGVKAISPTIKIVFTIKAGSFSKWDPPKGVIRRLGIDWEHGKTLFSHMSRCWGRDSYSKAFRLSGESLGTSQRNLGRHVNTRTTTGHEGLAR